MPREKELFMDNLERLDKAFPNQEMLKIVDVQRYTGMRYEVVKKFFDFNGCYISKVKLARQLSQEVKMLQIIFGCIGMAAIILSAIRNYVDCVTGGENEKN